jgi:hypothetical protein
MTARISLSILASPGTEVTRLWVLPLLSRARPMRWRWRGPGLRFVAETDATAMTGAERAACLRGLERADAVVTAARISVLGAFGAGQGYTEDGDYSPRSWLEHRTRVTRGVSAEHAAWLRRAAEHPAVQAALAAGAVSVSYAREICRWTGSMPGRCAGGGG